MLCKYTGCLHTYVHKRLINAIIAFSNNFSITPTCNRKIFSIKNTRYFSHVVLNCSQYTKYAVLKHCPPTAAGRVYDPPWVPRKLVYRHFVYDTSSNDISSTSVIVSITANQQRPLSYSFAKTFYIFSGIQLLITDKIIFINPIEWKPIFIHASRLISGSRTVHQRTIQGTVHQRSFHQGTVHHKNIYRFSVL